MNARRSQWKNKTQTKASGKTQNLDKDNKQKTPKKNKIKTVEKLLESGHKETPAAAKSFQSCPTLWDPIDGSPPGPAIPGILQARTLEWVAISFSNA